VAKEPGLAAMLHYDPYERRSGLVRFLAPGTTAEAWAAADAIELGDAVDGAYEIETLELDRLVVGRDASVSTGAGEGGATVRVVKTFTLSGDRRSPTLLETVEVTNRSGATVDATLGLEWTVTMLGGGGNPAAWLEIDGERTSHDSPRTASAQNAMAQGNDFIGVAIATAVSPPADIWCAPVETISNSEAGFERVYQGEGLLLGWPLSLAAGASQTVTVRHAVATSRDHADEERQAMMTEPSIS
jgi:alpha-amylase